MNRAPITTVTNWTKTTYRVGDGRRCVWMVPQVMDWNCYTYDKENRAPTMDEMIVMSYLSLIEGARGMIYYSYFDLQRDSMGFDKRWADVMVMGKEIEKLIPAALSLEKPERLGVDCNKDINVKYALKADDNKNTYVLLANVNKTKATVIKVSIPAGRRVEILRHANLSDVTSDVKSGKLTITLPPTQAASVIVYR